MDICVCNPVTDKFTTFDIIIHATDPAFTLPASRTRRRFNDFCWLRKLLRKHHPLTVCPELPEKKSSRRFEIQFLVQRMSDLESWLNRVLDVNLFKSDTSVHLFLQTDLSCNQIEQYINGRLSEHSVEEHYRNSAYTGPCLRGSNPDRPDEWLEITHPVTMRHRANSKQRDDSGVAGLGSSCESDTLSFESRSSSPGSQDSAVSSQGPYPALTLCNSFSKDNKSAADAARMLDSVEWSDKHNRLVESVDDILDTESDVKRTGKRVHHGVIFSIN